MSENVQNQSNTQAVNQQNILNKDHDILGVDVRVYRKQNTTIKAYLVSKERLEKIFIKRAKQLFGNIELRNELYRPYTYVLTGDYEDTNGKFYVGHSGAVHSEIFWRLNDHIKNDEKNNKKYWDKWDKAIVFMSFDEDRIWSGDDVKFFEREIFDEAGGKSGTFNGERPDVKDENNPPADLDFVIETIKQYLRKFGINLFKQPIKKEDEDIVSADISCDKLINMSGNEIKHIQIERLDKDEYEVPQIVTNDDIVKEMIERLPPETWKSTPDKNIKEKKFIDLACKKGEFLKAIYHKLLNKCPDLKEEIENDSARERWILNNMLYGLAINDYSAELAREALYNNSFEIGNIVCLTDVVNISEQTKGKIGNINIDYIDIIKNRTKDTKISLNYSLLDKITEIFGYKYITNKEGKKDMKFDVVIGNPPYNDTVTKKATALYGDFMIRALEISSSLVSFIVPARWYNSGRGLSNLRNTLLSEGHLKTLVDFPNTGDVFNDKNVSISGGVCYYVYDKNYTGDCRVIERNKNDVISDTFRDLSKNESFIRDIKALGIIEKIRSIYNSNTYMDFGVQSVDYFSVKDNPFIRGFKHSDEDIPIADSSGTLYAERQHLADPKGLIDSYNVIVTHAVGGKGYVITNTIRVLEMGEACSVTYLCVGGTLDRINAVHLMSYIKTKFCRFLMSQAISGINISAKSFMFVPIQDFTSNSDIDWHLSIASIDQQLYKKYNLSDEEIAYIEQTIKPMV